MKFNTVKAKDKIALEGVSVEVEFVNDNPESVTITDSAGGILRIIPGQYSGIRVMVPAPPAMKTAYRLHGTIAGLPVDQIFDDEDEAEDKFRELGRQTMDGACSLEITRIEVPEEA